MKFFQLYRRECLAFFLSLFCFLGATLWINHYLNFQYKTAFLKTNAAILNEIHEKYPALEYEMIDILKNISTNDNLRLLEEYGFSTESLDSLTEVYALEKKTNMVVFLFFMGSFLVCSLFVLFFYIYRQRRILQINEYLFRVLQNDFQYDLGDYNEDAISSLKIDLMKITNKLRNASEVSFVAKKNLERTLSDISHQLRTPLTSLYIMNDALKSKNLQEKERLSFLQQQKEQLERMEWLIVTLLKMSQIDSGSIVFHKKEEVLKEVVEEALKPILIPLELKNIHCHVDIDKELTLQCDFHWTVEALVNLIKNACEHTQVDGKLSIVAHDNPMFLELVIEDNGCGIKKEDIRHIFERFYKGNTKTESIGIGLNLSKTILENQNATIHVESTEGKGTQFVIHFYKVTV